MGEGDGIGSGQNGGPADDVPPVGPSHRDGPMLFVSDLDDPELDRDDYHHVSRVLRTPDGSPIVLCDGRGSWRTATLAQRPVPTGEVRTDEARRPPIVVAFAIVKGDRPELVTQKLTELGVDVLAPLECDHGVVRWKGERAAKQRDRLERIAREASMQCRRTHLPVVESPCTLDTLLARFPDAFRCDVGGGPLGVLAARDLVDADGPAVVAAVGPEGGWSERERALGGRVASVGDHILRSETAAMTVGALMCALRSGHVGPAI